MSVILRPASLFYRLLTRARNALYDRGVFSIYRSSLPVISIGNLTVGGTGKTPLTNLICRELKARGLEPVVLSRGYRGKVRAPRHVAPNDSPSLVGDEPLMLAQQDEFPVVVSPDRVWGAKFIEDAALGSVIVLDDGMQHRRLARDLDILSIDCSSDAAVAGFCAGRLLPEGRFREDRDLGVRRVQAIVLNSRRPKALAPDTAAISRLLPGTTSVFHAFVEAVSIEEVRSGQQMTECAEILPFCAIGNPEGFIATAASLGYPILPAVTKRDHESFSTAELLDLHQAYPKAVLVCSAKDATKIPSDTTIPIYVLRVSLLLGDRDRLMTLITDALTTRKVKP